MNLATPNSIALSSPLTVSIGVWPRALSLFLNVGGVLMALKGEAFLAIWHDIDPPQQEEYMEWHTREHMPERISIPGFSLGKRLINQDLNAYQYGTIYCGDRLDDELIWVD